MYLISCYIGIRRPLQKSESSMKTHVNNTQKFLAPLKILSHKQPNGSFYQRIKPFFGELVLLAFIIFLLVSKTERVEQAAFDASCANILMDEINDLPDNMDANLDTAKFTAPRFSQV